MFLVKRMILWIGAVLLSESHIEIKKGTSEQADECPIIKERTPRVPQPLEKYEIIIIIFAYRAFLKIVFYIQFYNFLLF